jgi:hypothetical protein
MATTTPNFGWPVPTSTDLVKDGATAIEGLGDAIDASLLDLKGGTTNQVLAKNSNTDMDFKWVADASGIPATIVDAKGDLIAGTAADTVARLAVGANGETLVADSSTSTGLRYTAGTIQGNPVLNSAFQIWQRGTSITGAGGGVYAADRWNLYAGGQASASRQATGDTTNLPFIQYCARVQRANGSSDTTAIPFTQSFETINSIPYAGKTVTLSFYARRGANYSATSNALPFYLVTGTGTDQSVVGTYTGSANTISSTATLTTTWQRFTASATVPTTTTEMAVYFNFAPTGTAGAADFFEITGVQIDVGSVALPFRTYAGTIQGELAACQRYLPAISGLSYEALGFTYSTTGSQYVVKLPVTARVAPTGMTVSNVSHFTVYNTGFSGGSPTALTMNTSSIDTFSINATTTAGSPTLVSSTPVKLQITNASGSILFTGCEL